MLGRVGGGGRRGWLCRVGNLRPYPKDATRMVLWRLHRHLAESQPTSPSSNSRHATRTVCMARMPLHHCAPVITVSSCEHSCECDAVHHIHDDHDCVWRSIRHCLWRITHLPSIHSLASPPPITITHNVHSLTISLVQLSIPPLSWVSSDC